MLEIFFRDEFYFNITIIKLIYFFLFLPFFRILFKNPQHSNGVLSVFLMNRTVGLTVELLSAVLMQLREVKEQRQ